jgi:hypothetical protein
MRSAAELAAEMDAECDRINDHLNILSEANLVSPTVVGDEKLYQFNSKTLEEVSRQNLSRKTTANDVSALNLDRDKKRIILNYTNGDGSLKSIPTKSTKINAVLEYIILAFNLGEAYSEDEVNKVLIRFHPDTTTLRRLLIDYGKLDREKDGSSYWRQR